MLISPRNNRLLPHPYRHADRERQPRNRRRTATPTQVRAAVQHALRRHDDRYVNCHTLLHGNGVVRIQSDIRVGSRTDKVQSFADKVSAVEKLLAAGDGDEGGERRG
nr:hypothetical protein CFP56_31740 [Quercus suber]